MTWEAWLTFIAIVTVWFAGTILTTRLINRQLNRMTGELVTTEKNVTLLVFSGFVWPLVLPFAAGWTIIDRLSNPGQAERGRQLAQVVELRSKAENFRSTARQYPTDSPLYLDLIKISDEYNEQADQLERQLNP